MRKIFITLLALGLGGCSAFSSQALQQDVPARGLVYFLPNSDVLAKITIDANGIKNISIGTTEHYPDTTIPYLLTHNHGPFATHVSDVTIKNGLLTTVKGTNTSAMPAIAEAVAAIASRTSNLDKSLCPSGEHTVSFPVDSGQQILCGVTFNVIPLFDPQNPRLTTKRDQEDALPQFGVYYKVMLPYRVTAAANGVVQSAVVHSPTKSPAFFLPSPSGLFSSPSSEFALNDGVPTSYKQTTQGELASAIKFPADVLSAYTTAVGSLLTGLKNNSEKELEYRKQILQLEIYRQKQAACLDAIKEGDQSKVEALGCMTP